MQETNNVDKIEALLKKFNYGLEPPKKLVDDKGVPYKEKRIYESGFGDTVEAWVNRGWDGVSILGVKNDAGYVTKDGLVQALTKEFGDNARLQFQNKYKVVDEEKVVYGKFIFTGLNGPA